MKRIVHALVPNCIISRSLGKGALHSPGQMQSAPTQSANLRNLVLAALLIVTCSSAEAADQNSAQSEQIKLKSAKWMERRQQSDDLAKHGKFQDAETLIQRTIDERKQLGLDLLSEYDSLGQLYMRWGKKAEAERTYEQMVAEREKQAGSDDLTVCYPLRQYANCLEKNGKKAQAKDLRNKAAAIEKEANTMPTFAKITAAPGSPERLAEAEKVKAIGEKLLASDQQPKAFFYFNRAVELNPNDPVALRGRAETLSWQNQFTKARTDLDKAIKLKPDYAKAYIDRAWLNENVKKYQAAIADFNKAISLDPKDTESMGARAKLLDEMGKHADAIEGYSKVIITKPDLYWPYVQRAVSYTAIGQYKAAIADYTTLVERAPQDSDYYEYRGAVYLKASELKNALADFNQLIKLNPKYSVGYHERAKIYEKLDGKKSPRVVADYAQARKLGY